MFPFYRLIFSITHQVEWAAYPIHLNFVRLFFPSPVSAQALTGSRMLQADKRVVVEDVRAVLGVA